MLCVRIDDPTTGLDGARRESAGVVGGGFLTFRCADPDVEDSRHTGAVAACTSSAETWSADRKSVV